MQVKDLINRKYYFYSILFYLIFVFMYICAVVLVLDIFWAVGLITAVSFYIIISSLYRNKGIFVAIHRACVLKDCPARIIRYSSIGYKPIFAMLQDGFKSGSLGSEGCILIHEFLDDFKCETGDIFIIYADYVKNDEPCMEMLWVKSCWNNKGGI